MMGAMRREAFERLYEAHAEPLLAFLVYRTGDRELAEDVHADTFERVLLSRRFDPRRGSEKTWLYTIALNRLRDHYRRVGAEARAIDRATAGIPAATSGGSTIEDREALLAALSTLSEEEREAVALRYGADLSLREIASAAGTRTTTIKGRIHRGLRKLREELG
jgi:RNA polymerase sigma-70 factor (ECF subfamily)